MGNNIEDRGASFAFKVKIRLLEKQNESLEEQIDDYKSRIKANKRSITWYKNRS